MDIVTVGDSTHNYLCTCVYIKAQLSYMYNEGTGMPDGFYTVTSGNEDDLISGFYSTCTFTMCMYIHICNNFHIDNNVW